MVIIFGSARSWVLVEVGLRWWLASARSWVGSEMDFALGVGSPLGSPSALRSAHGFGSRSGLGSRIGSASLRVGLRLSPCSRLRLPFGSCLARHRKWISPWVVSMARHRVVPSVMASGALGSRCRVNFGLSLSLCRLRACPWSSFGIGCARLGCRFAPWVSGQLRSGHGSLRVELRPCPSVMARFGSPLGFGAW